MVFANDTEKKLLAPLAEKKDDMRLLYSFSLMLGGGSIKGYAVEGEALEALWSAIFEYESSAKDGLVYAMGDGNHSLASATAYYEELKASLGDKAKTHPARYALVEIVNIHSEALVFEPIYRVVFGADRQDLLGEMEAFAKAQSGDLGAQNVTVVYKENNKECKEEFTFPVGAHSLTVGTLQIFLDDYIARHPEAEVDYIHDESSLLALAARDGAVGFLFDGMKKDELFGAVAHDGALPRKTFSMGTAREKRYYLEAREISL
jgi:hypothetical protein